MSSHEPFWYCHECHAEMRPLMTPDPVCASCHGSFVEKIENPSDDPREFQQDDIGPVPTSIEPLLMAFSNLLQDRRVDRRSPVQDTGRPSSGLSFQVRSGPAGRFVTVSGSPPLRSRSPTTGVPTMSEYLRRDEAGDENRIAGPLMLQYLMALLGRDPFIGEGPGLEQGQFGDYVFSQEALDRIITQIMENSNSNRPVPATQEIVDNLPREVLEVGSPMLEKDCAVCKEQFKTDTDDPDEQVVVTLPCKHPFHEPCILPWLKSSGTCPVCRHALVPQPEQHPNPGNSGAGPTAGRSSSPGNSPAGNNDGLLHSLFGYLGSGRPGNNNGGGTRGGSSTQRSGNRRSTEDHVPGHWDELD